MSDYRTVPIGQIIPRGTQVRQVFDREFLDELKESMTNDGMLCPLLVRETDGKLEIIAGEQRWKAAKSAGLKEIPVVILNVDNTRAVELAFIENAKRRDLTSKEREDAVAAMWQSGKYKTHTDIADRLGVGRDWISTLLSSRDDRKRLQVGNDVSTKVIDTTRCLDDESRVELIKATQAGKITKEAHAVGKLATMVKQAKKEVRPAIVKALADEEISTEEAKEIAEVAEDKHQVRDLVHAKKTHGPDELKKTTSIIKRSKARGETPAPIRTIIKGPEKDWNFTVETIQNARDTLYMVNASSLKKMSPIWKKKVHSILLDIDKYIAEALEAIKER